VGGAVKRNDCDPALVLGLATLAVFAFGLLYATLASGCAAVESVEPTSDTSACERAKPDNAECATVYAFAEPADNELGHIELCVREQDLRAAQLEHGIAWPSDSERFAKYAAIGIDPPCFWCCTGDCGRGANALNGTYCGGVWP
jgi:hypothetical protein